MDRFSRGCRTAHVAHIAVYGSESQKDISGVTVLHVEVDGGLNFTPGQYCFLNIPHISHLEWHPFTISGAKDGLLTFHIKAMGPGAFTGKLAALAGTAVNLPVCVDGPYGTPPELEDCSCAIFVVGGIGITPAHAILSAMCAGGTAAVPCHLVWVVRQPSEIDMFRDSLVGLQAAGVTLSLFATRGTEDSKTDPSNELEVQLMPSDRIDLEAQMENSKTHDLAEPPFVFACGPNGLVARAQIAAMARGFEFHSETFEL